MRGKSPAIDRRRMLVLGATGAASLGAAGYAGAQQPAQAGARPVLTAAATEGPFYFDPKLERADITEGLPGVPLEVRFAVVDEAGEPFANARVDIWHCDAAGIYSGYAGQGDDRQASALGKTFLRGHQKTDAQGAVSFRTVYPGWYRGRTTHIHFKVQHGEKPVLTSQFFLPDALSEFLYENLPDYRRSQTRDTLNSTDGIALQAGETVIGNVREAADRYVVTLNIAVDRSGSAGAGRGFGGRRQPAPTGKDRVDALVPGGKA